MLDFVGTSKILLSGLLGIRLDQSQHIIMISYISILITKKWIKIQKFNTASNIEAFALIK